MNEWDEAYKRLNKVDPQLDCAYEDDLIHAIYGAIWMVVAIGLMTGAIFFGAQWLGIL